MNFNMGIHARKLICMNNVYSRRNLVECSQTGHSWSHKLCECFNVYTPKKVKVERAKVSFPLDFFLFLVRLWPENSFIFSVKTAEGTLYNKYLCRDRFHYRLLRHFLVKHINLISYTLHLFRNVNAQCQNIKQQSDSEKKKKHTEHEFRSKTMIKCTASRQEMFQQRSLFRSINNCCKPPILRYQQKQH